VCQRIERSESKRERSERRIGAKRRARAAGSYDRAQRERTRHRVARVARHPAKSTSPVTLLAHGLGDWNFRWMMRHTWEVRWVKFWPHLNFWSRRKFCAPLGKSVLVSWIILGSPIYQGRAAVDVWRPPNLIWVEQRPPGVFERESGYHKGGSIANQNDEVGQRVTAVSRIIITTKFFRLHLFWGFTLICYCYGSAFNIH